MKNSVALITIMLFVLTFGAWLPKPTKVELVYPADWGKPNYDFVQNPLTAKKIELGRKLFYDPLLSKDGLISCASCHLSYTAFTHTDHALSHGVFDSIGTRNSPVLINLAWNKHFMWDGAINHIEVQALAPINHPAEMGETTLSVVNKLQKDTTYQQLFYQAFGEKEITGQNLLKALAQFQLTLVSANSKYDKKKRGEEELNQQENKGYQLFQKHCNSCHQEPLFTNGEFENNGLQVDTTLNDWGRYGITQNPNDSLKFKVPTLRNIEFSYPYMHDGRMKSLTEVMNHYTNEIQETKTLAAQLKGGIKLTSNEKVDIVAFLLTLSDKEFLFNKKFAYPR